MANHHESHFVNLPKLNVSRSRFPLNFSCKTSFNAGSLIPLCKAIEVLPGDSFKWTTSSLVRLDTLIAPIMDDMYLDTFFFFVPFRLLWTHFPNFLGENDSAPWVQETTYSIPQITSPTGGWSVGTIADYFGFPTGVENISVSALPFRAYSKIVKDWFYDENNQTPPDFLDDDATIIGSNGNDYVVDLIKGGMPFTAAKFHDLFTSALPAPQKGASVVLPLGDNAPIYSDSVDLDFKDYMSKYPNEIGARFASYNSLSQETWNNQTGNVGLSNSNLGVSSISQGTWNGSVFPINLRADLSSATATTINDLRLAFQTQRLLERMARGGTRYFEILASQWGVIPPQGLIQRSEYLGGSRSNIQVNSVVQTSATDSTSPQGNVSAYSVSTNKHQDFFKSFSEPGYIIALGCVRYNHSYCQGIPKSYMRKNKFDFYNHAFAYIGEQPINNYEIYMQGNSVDNDVFGYNEAWVDYRYNSNMITGEMRTTYNLSLDYWHLGDKFDSLPTLSADFIKEDKNNVDRVIAVQSSNSHQFVGEFYFDIDAIRPMPLYSIPGLIDHM